MRIVLMIIKKIMGHKFNTKYAISHQDLKSIALLTLMKISRIFKAKEYLLLIKNTIIIINTTN
jgi:hypothetical protein